MSDRKIVDLTAERAARKPAVTRFVLEARDIDSGPGRGRLLWDYTIEDTGQPDQWRPSTAQVSQMLRRVAERYDPQPRPRRAKVTPRARRR